MSTFTKPSAKQIESRDLLSTLAPYIAKPLLDALLRSINAEVQAPCRLDASSTPNLVVAVQSSQVSNPTSNRQHSIGHVGNSVPVFTSGTITFPASNGGNIVPSVGSSIVLNCPVGQYAKVLVSIDSGANLVLTMGVADSVEANALVPAAVPTANPVGWIGVHNTGGTIDNIIQSKIVQFMGSGGGGSSASTGYAQEVSIPAAATSLVVTFPAALPSSAYVVLPQMVNTVDGTPDFQPLTITAKTAAGFTVTWNAPTDTANYKLAYITPAVQEAVGEVLVPLAADNLVVTLPIALAGVNYSVIANLVNLVDGAPQFQPVTIVAKTATTFTVRWNAPTDTSAYRLAFHVAEFQ